MTTFTQEDIDAAVAQVRAELETKISELTAKNEQSEAEARFIADREELEAQIVALQADHDGAVLRADQAEKDYIDLVAFLEGTEAETAAAAALAEARTGRLEKVAAYNFAEEYVTANADRWAAMSEDDFAALTSDWDAVLAKREQARSTATGSVLPKATAMTASSEEIDSTALMAEVLNMKFNGNDPRKL